jgi:hypothetical protein
MTYLVYLNSLIRPLIVVVTSFAAASTRAYQTITRPGLSAKSGIQNRHNVAALAIWIGHLPAQALQLQPQRHVSDLPLSTAE